MKIYFSFGSETREDFGTLHPSATANIEADSIEEIQGQDVLEKVPNLISFIEECYRILKPGAKAIFSSPHFVNVAAWRSPLTIRGIGEQSLNFSDKKWREETKYTEASVSCDFEVQGSFALEQDVMNRSEEARQFWMRRYVNVAQAVMFTLIKKIPDEPK